METLANDPAPSVQSGFDAKPSVLVAGFGRGYEQRSGDGPPANLLLEWPLVWSNISKAKAGELHEFFKAHGGWKRFLWTPVAPHDAVEKAFICEEWHGQYVGGDIVNFTATLKERPAL
jgi:phage-related protein